MTVSCLAAVLTFGGSSTEFGAAEKSIDEKTDRLEIARRQTGSRVAPQMDPYSFISSGNLLASLTELTAIGSHNGWRHSTTRGEVAAVDYVQKRLERLGFLRSLGLESKRHGFRTYLGIDFHETRLRLQTGTGTVEVAADAPPGHRERIDLAIRFDSDGVLNDTRPDPVVVEGTPLLVSSAAEIYDMTPTDVEGRVVFLDYDVVDRVINTLEEAVDRAWTLAELGPRAIVMVTSYSNQRGLSHGSFSTDLPAFTWVQADPMPPVLVVRLEDMDRAGVDDWEDIDDIESVSLTWDVDILSPGESALLMARIPGADSSKSVILGAHIDSSNTPGAFDNGSGSVALVEVAEALNRSRTVPPVDLYLVWFASHERGVYGSASFASANSELIDRSLAMLQMDCLGHPVDDISNFITFEAWPYGRFGDASTPWPDYLEDATESHGIATLPIAYYGLGSDNGNFNAENLPNANLIYMNPYDIEEIHYDNHLHDPYDTVEVANLEADVFENMARVMLVAALQTGEDQPDLRVTPEPTRRAVLVASHTEAVHMTTSSFIDFGMTLAWEGFDVDTVPYGKTVTAADLEDADLVIALPVHDYPSEDGDVTLYDEAWTSAEIDILESYVRNGGMLLLTNSGHRLKYSNYVYEDNEDWSDVNDLGERFGVRYSGGAGPGESATVTGVHALVEGVEVLELADANGIHFSLESGEVLARTGVRNALGIVAVSSGEVLVVSDLGILGNRRDEPENIPFWRNLARYARSR
jgi:hypothetical protein